jgi:YVTN family beta-propeller protein
MTVRARAGQVWNGSEVITMRKLFALIAASAVAVTGLALLTPAAQAADIVTTLPVGAQPWGVAISPDGSRAYVANRNSASVSVISLADNTVVGTIPVGLGPTGVVVSRDGSRVYVANRTAHTISVINTADLTSVGTIPAGGEPMGLSLSPDGSRLYATLVDTAHLAAISTSTLTVVSSAPVGPQPFSVAVSPDGSWAFVANRGANSVSVLALPAMAAAGDVAVGAEPFAIVADPAAGAQGAYSANFLGNSVTQISRTGAAWTAVRTIPVPNSPTGLAFSQDGSRLYVTRYAAAAVATVNVANGAIAQTVPVAGGPMGIAVSPDGSAAAVANLGAASVSVLAVGPHVKVLPAIDVFGTTAMGQATVRATGTDAATQVECVLAESVAGLSATGTAAPIRVPAVPATVAVGATQTVGCEFDDLMRGTEYFYTASAADSDGVVTALEPSSFTTRPARVGTVTAVRKKRWLRLKWGAVHGALYYQARIRIGGTYGAWRQTTAKRMKFAGLQRHTLYRIQLRAGNDSGNGPRRTVKVWTR